MVQRWMAEGVEKDETGEWVLFADHEREVTAQAVVDGLVRNRLCEALREALNAWEGWLEEYHGVGVKVMGCTDRIAELRKLLEPSSVFDDPAVVARGKAILEEAGRKLAQAVDRDYDERHKA